GSYTARKVARESRDTERKCSPSCSDRLRHTRTPRTLLPLASSSGEYVPIPSCPGSTATMPPPTPLLAGMPTALTQSPAASYMPHVTITDSVRFTTAAVVTRLPVMGLTPPRASVAPILARSVDVTLNEHWRKYTSNTSSGSPSITPKL